MEKTKLGISIKLLGGALYFIALLGMTPLLIAAGYALIMEENQWLKRVAVKAVGVVIFFTILSSTVGLLSSSTSFLNNFILLFRDRPLNLATIMRITSLLQNTISILQTLCLLLLGFRAMNMRDVGVGPVDGAINKNM